MALFVIERNFAEQMQLTNDAARLISEVNDDAGVHWLFSFLSADQKKTYCLYEAPNAEAIREAARGLGMSPAQQLRRIDLPLALPAIGTWRDPALVDTMGGAAKVTEGLAQAAEAFASTYWVAAFMVMLTLVPAMFLPRSHEESHLLDDVEGSAPVVIH